MSPPNQRFLLVLALLLSAELLLLAVLAMDRASFLGLQRWFVETLPLLYRSHNYYNEQVGMTAYLLAMAMQVGNFLVLLNLGGVRRDAQLLEEARLLPRARSLALRILFPTAPLLAGAVAFLLVIAGAMCVDIRHDSDSPMALFQPITLGIPFVAIYVASRAALLGSSQALTRRGASAVLWLAMVLSLLWIGNVLCAATTILSAGVALYFGGAIHRHLTEHFSV